MKRFLILLLRINRYFSFKFNNSVSGILSNRYTIKMKNFSGGRDGEFVIMINSKVKLLQCNFKNF